MTESTSTNGVEHDPELPSRAGAIVVIGVCGCGKSTVGRMLARKLGSPFLEGDAFHPPANIEKMSRGIALQDADRWPWLEALGAAAREQGSAMAACSALTRAYRDRLAAAAGMRVRFVHLTGTRALLAARMAMRMDHFMPPSLLDSQLATLEPPRPTEPALTLAGELDRPGAGMAGPGAGRTALMEQTRRGTRRRCADRLLHDTPPP